MNHISHHRGLRQGDSLSPFLFILAIDPMHRILETALARGLLQAPPGRHIRLWVRLYTDDVVIFANPVHEEIDSLLIILKSS